MDLLLSILISFFGLEKPSDLFNEIYGEPQVCKSTIFGTKGDKWAGGNAIYYGRPIKPNKDIGIAHRRAPIGSLVIVSNPKNRRWVVARVVDRGPYGAIVSGDKEPHPEQICRQRRDGRTWCVKTKAHHVGRWRGCADMTPKTAKLLKHNGLQKVRIWRIPKTKVPRRMWPARKRK